MKSTEALVVGGGPAGAASALAMRKLGFNVTLLESSVGTAPGAWKKVCGSFLNLESVNALDKMGLLDAVRDAGGRPVSHLLIAEPSGHTVRISLVSSGRSPLALRRSTLDGLLLEEADRQGVRVKMGVEMREIESQRAFYELIVLADGKRCRWGDSRDRWGGRSEEKGAAAWYGWSADFSDSRTSSDIELYLFEGGYVGLLSFADGTTNLCGLSRQSLLRSAGGDLDGLVGWAASVHPPLGRRLNGMSRLSPWRAVGPLPFGRATPVSNGCFLVGDAAAVIDPFVGGGIGMALRSGSLLASALSGPSHLEGRLEAYRRLWDGCFERRLWTSRYFRVCLAEARRLRFLVSVMERWPSSLGTLARFFCAQAAA